MAAAVNQKYQESRPYQQAYFLMKELTKTPATLMSMEGFERLSRAIDYCGWRYNSIVLGGTEFAPPEWTPGAEAA